MNLTILGATGATGTILVERALACVGRLLYPT